MTTGCNTQLQGVPGAPVRTTVTPHMATVRRRAGELAVEHEVRTRAAELPLDFSATGVMANAARVTDAFRSHLERTALARVDVNWPAYNVLYQLWLWGDMDTRELAELTFLTKGILTSTVTTLEDRNFVARKPLPDDKRFVLVKLTANGKRAAIKLVQEVNAQEVAIAEVLATADKGQVAASMRALLLSIDELAS